ncbi:MAG: amidohydrolase/deacetylase family metallohydrolase [Chloroflexota bacterium]
MAYDLLIKGGHVLDPGQHLDGTLDIGIRDGKIAAIQPDIATHEATRTIQVHGADRYVVPGLVDIHTHVAYGAQTPGVGMLCVDPDVGGVQSGVTTVVDGGSVGVANIGVFKFHILPRVKTRVLVFLNVGSFAHTMPGGADVNRLDEIDRPAIAACLQANPGLVHGFKLRLVGPLVAEQGEQVIRLASDISREHNLPLMVHIGDGQGDPRRHSELTRLLLDTFRPGDILTHLCTPSPGGVMVPDEAAQEALPEVREARERGVVLDPALGRGNFGIHVARRQAEMGLHPDTLSSDVTLGGRSRGVGLLDSMSKFLSLGYSLPDVVRMASCGAARAVGLQEQAGALAVGRSADVTIFDVVRGTWKFTDTKNVPFTGDRALVPVQTVRAGDLFSPDWGPYAWGWLPEEG